MSINLPCPYCGEALVMGRCGNIHCYHSGKNPYKSDDDELDEHMVEGMEVINNMLANAVVPDKDGYYRCVIHDCKYKEIQCPACKQHNRALGLKADLEEANTKLDRLMKVAARYVRKDCTLPFIGFPACIDMWPGCTPRHKAVCEVIEQIKPWKPKVE